MILVTQTQKHKKMLVKVILMMHLNQSVLLNQTYKNL